MGSADWTVRSALEWMQGYLDRKGDEHPRQSAEWLLSWACGLSRIELYMDMDRPLSAEERTRLHDGVQRRGTGEPLQYISGSAPFRHLTLAVRPGVLIPRPETEVLVSEAMMWLPPAPEHRGCWSEESDRKDRETLRALKEALAAAQGVEGEADALPPSEDCDGAADGRTAQEEAHLLVADLCTGSGNIACALASERPDVRVIATDVSADAVSLAKENVSACGLDGSVHVLQGSLGDPIPERFFGKLDLVISNPPYIPSSILRSLPQEVGAFEPKLALDGGPDGLGLYRQIASWARNALAAGGVLAVELHETCLDEAAQIAADMGFVEVTVREDLARRPRVLLARTPV